MTCCTASGRPERPERQRRRCARRPDSRADRRARTSACAAVRDRARLQRHPRGRPPRCCRDPGPCRGSRPQHPGRSALSGSGRARRGSRDGPRPQPRAQTRSEALASQRQVALVRDLAARAMPQYVEQVVASVRSLMEGGRSRRGPPRGCDMSAGWVAASVRARAMTRRRSAGLRRAPRGLASTDAAVSALAQTTMATRSGSASRWPRPSGQSSTRSPGTRVCSPAGRREGVALLRVSLAVSSRWPTCRTTSSGWRARSRPPPSGSGASPPPGRACSRRLTRAHSGRHWPPHRGATQAVRPLGRSRWRCGPRRGPGHRRGTGRRGLGGGRHGPPPGPGGRPRGPGGASTRRMGASRVVGPAAVSSPRSQRWWRRCRRTPGGPWPAWSVQPTCGGPRRAGGRGWRRTAPRWCAGRRWAGGRGRGRGPHGRRRVASARRPRGRCARRGTPVEAFHAVA